MWWEAVFPRGACDELAIVYRIDHFIGGVISGVAVLFSIQLLLMCNCYLRSRPARVLRPVKGRITVSASPVRYS